MAIEGMFQKEKSTKESPKVNLKPISKEIAKIVDNMPVSPEDISINNFDEVKLHLRTELAPVVKAINKLPEPAKSVEVSNFPIPPDKMKVEDLQKITEAINDLRAIMAQVEYKPTINVSPPKIPEIKVPKIDVRVPDVNVPTPQVTVNPKVDIDLTKLLKALQPLQLLSYEADKPISVQVSDGEDFVKAMKETGEQILTTFSGGVGLTQDEFRDTVRKYEDKISSYPISDTDEQNDSPRYYGYVRNDAKWFIMKETNTAQLKTYRYITGDSDYATNWTNRAALTYSYVYEVTF